MAGVTRQNIYHLVDTGTIKQTSDGLIDTANPINAGYLKMAKSSGRTGKSGKPIVGAASFVKRVDTLTQGGADSEPGKVRTGPPSENVGLEDDFAGEDPMTRKFLLDNRIKEQRIRAENLKHQERIGATIPKEVVARTDAHLSAVMEEQFRFFPDRVVDEICDALAITEPEKRVAIMKIIVNEIDVSLSVMKSSIIDRLEKMKIKDGTTSDAV
jgi:hypothetical protein